MCKIVCDFMFVIYHTICSIILCIKGSQGKKQKENPVGGTGSIHEQIMLP